jgi:arylsulfatase A-like enzyme
MKIGVRAACGIAVLALGSTPGCMRATHESGRNVLLIVVDTLRADHLGTYGYPRPTSPRMDELAARGARFANARAASSWTLPSVASLFTGVYPAVHGAESVGTVVSERLRTMPEAFRDAGYATAAVSANPAFVTPTQGFARGFQRFDVLHGPPTERESPAAVSDSSLESWFVGATAKDVTTAALGWLAARPPAQPFFLYLHYFDPHAAYSPPPEMARRFGVADGDPLAGPAQWPVLLARTPPAPDVLGTLVALYDAEVASTDAAIGRLLDGLPRGVTDSTIVVVTADHGEEFEEHGGMQHGRTLFDELLRVPLVIAGPGVPQKLQVDAPVSLVGLWPTIAALAGAGAPTDAVAHASFAPLLRGAGAPPPVFADLDERYPGDPQRHRRALIEGSRKLLMDTQRGAALYDLGQDPGEHTVLTDSRELQSRMRAQILDRDAVAVASRATAPPGRIPFDPTWQARLKALGYLQ